MKQKNVLITSSGNKQILIEYLKNEFNRIDRNVSIISTDISSSNLSYLISDSFFQFGVIQNHNVYAFVDECKKRNISLIIPSSNSDASLLSKHATKFKEVGIEILVSENQFVDLCIDKLKFSEYFESKSSSILRSTLNLSEVNGENIVVKERFGAGSLGIKLNLKKSEISSSILDLKNPIFQAYLQGQEFSADIWVNKDFSVHAIGLRKRQVIQFGESIQCEFFENSFIVNEIYKILQNEQVRGPLNIQGFINSSGDFKFIEINPRFGGAFLMSKFVGFEVAKWIYEEYLYKKPISDFKYVVMNKKVIKVSNYATI